MIHKVLIVGLFLAVSLDVCLGRPNVEAKAMKEYADAIIQGATISCQYHVSILEL